MTEQVEGQMSMFDPDTWCGRMFLEHCQAPEEVITEKTSRPSSRKSSGSHSQKPPMCLCLTGGGGAKQDVYTMNWVGGQLLGEYTMHSFGESPREGNESRLSQILEDSAHPKYYLSAKACDGILRRAERRKKELPEELRQALEAQASV